MNRMSNPSFAELVLDSNNISGIFDILDKLYQVGLLVLAITTDNFFSYGKKAEDILIYLKKKDIYLVLYTKKINIFDIKVELSRYKLTIKIPLQNIFFSDVVTQSQKNIQKFVEKYNDQIPIAFCVELDKHNYYKLEKIAEFAVRNNVNYLNYIFNPNYKIPKLIYWTMLKELKFINEKFDLNLLSDFPLLSTVSCMGGICPAGRMSFFVDSDGSVKTCKFDNFVAGNLKKEKLLDIWHSSYFDRFSCTPEECTNCRYVKKCDGGCRVGLSEKGTCFTKNKDNYCIIDKNGTLLPVDSEIIDYFYLCFFENVDYRGLNTLIHNKEKSRLNYYLSLVQELVDWIDHDDLYNIEACIYHQLGDFEKEGEIFKNIKNIKNNYSFKHNYANYLFAIRSYFKAIQIFKELIKDFNYSDDYNNIACCYLQVEDYEKSILYFKKAISLDGKNIKFLNNFSVALIKNKKFILANEYLNMCLTNTKDKFEKAKILNNLGISYCRLGFKDLSEKNFLAALNEVPSFVPAKENLLKIKNPELFNSNNKNTGKQSIYEVIL